MDQVELTPAVMNSRQSRTLSLWEDYFEKTINKDKFQPKSRLNRLQKRGEKILHSQVLLLTVVVLNCVDCLLVLSELVLDVYFIEQMIVTAERTMETFNQLLKDKYPEHFAGFHVHDTHKFYNAILRSRLTCSLLSSSSVASVNRTARELGNGVEYNDIRGLPTTPVFTDVDDPHFLEEDAYSTEENISHMFHKASVTILGVLVVFTLFKVFCHGLAFVKHKLEVFDGIVVLASFTLDVCYIKGLTNYPVESFVLILAIMIPWRIIRVLNSLIIAVKDNFHFLLKLMYKKNKYQKDKLDKLDALTTQQQNMLECLVQLCSNNGITRDQMINSRSEFSSSKRRKVNTLPFGACFSRQVSFEQENQHTMVSETLPFIPDRTMEVVEELKPEATIDYEQPDGK